jgi:TonB-dependent receptor
MSRFLASSLVLPARACFALALVTLHLHLAPLAAQTGPTGAIRGVVTNEGRGGFVEGATVTLEGNPPRTANTDSQGVFYFGGVPVGAHRLHVESSGSQSGDITVTVDGTAAKPVSIRLGSEVVQLQAVMVNAQVEGQAQSLNLQRNSENIRNVVSEDALANSRLGEVGEALQAIPGVYLEASTHQPVRAFIRGMSSDFNSLTFDGVRIGTWQGTRDAQVGGFPAENLSRVEVMKSFTPDQEGDSIGGSINLVSKRAFDLPARLLRLSGGLTFNNQQRNWDKQVSFDYGDRFGADHRLGVFSSINYYRTDRAYHNIAQAYQVSAADVFNISTQTLLDRIEKGSWKLKYTGSVDYKLGEATVLSVKALLSDDRRFLADYRSVTRPGTRTNITPDRADSVNGRIDVDRQYREPETINSQVSVNLEHAIDLWQFDGAIGFNRITNTYSETMTPLMSFTGLNLSYDRTNRDFPVFTITNGADINNPARITLSTITRNQYDSSNNGYNFSGNARRDLVNLPFKAYLKSGFRVRLNDWKQDIGNQGVWNYGGALTPGQFTETYINDRFLRQSDGRVRMSTTVFPDIHKFIAAFYNRPGDFVRQGNASDLLLARGKKGFLENVSAGYLMGNVRFGDLTVVTGARVEVTDLEGWGHQVSTPAGIISRVSHVTVKTKSTDVLPSLNLIYSPTSQWQFRGAVTKTIARPNPQDILPVRTINDTTQVITDGNPDLRVTESINYDLGASYYLKPLGVISAGAFQKEIKGFYADVTETIPDGEFRGYQLTHPGMGTGGRIRGLELDVQKRLTFLPGWLSGFGVGANHTWLDAKGTYSNRPGVELPFNGSAKRNWNVNVFYARGPLDVRVFVNYRSPYLTAVGARAALDQYEDDRQTVNFFVKYKLSERWVFNVDVNNITDSAKRGYQGDPSNPLSNRYYDWAVNFRVALSL